LNRKEIAILTFELYNWRCTRCDEEEFALDSNSKNVYCTHCGYIVNENILVNHPAKLIMKGDDSMSSVTYSPDGETKDPKTLAGFISNHEILKQNAKRCDMMINNKTNEIAIMHTVNQNDTSLYAINVNTGILLETKSHNVQMGSTKITRLQIIKDWLPKEWEYIPVEQIKNFNFDIEMK
jgi:hypothetical protein